MKFLVVLEQVHDSKMWLCYCPELEISVEANTPRQALVLFSNKMKRLKKIKIEEVLELERSD